MPRYFFDVTDAETLRDDAGVELDGLDAARLYAVKLSGELLQSYPDRFWRGGDWSCSVRDEADVVLLTLHFFAADGAAINRPVQSGP